MFEGVEREHPHLALVLGVAGTHQGQTVEGRPALSEECTEADRDELGRFAHAELRAPLDGRDGTVGEDVAGKRHYFRCKGDREPERELYAQLVEDAVPASDR